MITPVIELDYSPDNGGEVVKRNNGQDISVNGSWICSLPPKMGEKDVVNYCKSFGVLNDDGEVVIKTCEPRIENEYVNDLDI